MRTTCGLQRLAVVPYLVAALGLVAVCPPLAAAYCTGTIAVPPTGYTWYECTDEVGGGTVVAVGGHRPGDGKPFIAVSCNGGDCHGYATVDGINSNSTGICHVETHGPQSSMVCPGEIVSFVFLINVEPS